MSEDQEWAARVLLAGHGLVYEPDAVVRHSHPYTIRAAFKRFFDSGASAERAFMPVPESARVLRRSALRYGRGELAWLWRHGHRRWIPYAVVYELAKFAGLALGARHRRLPPALKRRFSAHPGFWGREPRRLPAGR
jgi:rhamnosyltransferase